jgi:hypothetical protein
VCARTGWTWAYVWDCLEVPQIEALLRQWLDEPPVGALFAHFVGYKPPPKEPTSGAPAPKRPTAEQMAELARMFPGGTIRG